MNFIGPAGFTAHVAWLAASTRSNSSAFASKQLCNSALSNPAWHSWLSFCNLSDCTRTVIGGINQSEANLSTYFTVWTMLFCWLIFTALSQVIYTSPSSTMSRSRWPSTLSSSSTLPPRTYWRHTIRSLSLPSSNRSSSYLSGKVFINPSLPFSALKSLWALETLQISSLCSITNSIVTRWRGRLFEFLIDHQLSGVSLLFSI